MASVFAHALVGAAIGTAYTAPVRRGHSDPAPARRPWQIEIPQWFLLGAVCAVLPDADTFGFALGVNYGDFWGHRGFTHSILFAAFVACVLALTTYGPDKWDGVSRPRLWSFLFLATASHGILDALTTEGLGVAFFSPFDLGRYFFPWQPIQVSPIGVASFFSQEGLAVVKSEALYVGVPAGLFILGAQLGKRIRRIPEPVGEV